MAGDRKYGRKDDPRRQQTLLNQWMPYIVIVAAVFAGFLVLAAAANNLFQGVNNALPK